MNPTFQRPTPHTVNISRHIHRLLALLVSLLGLGAFVANAQLARPTPPGMLSFQGFLADADGNPLGKTAPTNTIVTFRIFDASTGGNLKWSEQQTVTVDAGHFSVLLGEGSAYPNEFHANDLNTVFLGSTASDRYLEMTVGTTVIAPRLQELSAPYSLLARNAVNVVDVNGSSVLQSSDVDRIGIYKAGVLGITLDGAGFVTASKYFGDGSSLTGINAANLSQGTLPDARLSSVVARRDQGNTFSGDQTFNNNIYLQNSATLLAKSAGGTYEAFLWPRWNDNVTYLNYGSGGFNIRNNSSTPVMWMSAGGGVGIGTTTPTGVLNIDEPTGNTGGANGGTLTLDHENNFGGSSIVFRSKYNRGSDYGFIQYLDNYGGASETARLVIGIQNDYDDDIVLAASGNVGVGTYQPTQAKLCVVGTSSYGVSYPGNISYVQYPSPGLPFGGYGVQQVNAGAQNVAIYVQGQAWFTGAIMSSSDQRVKNIRGRSDAPTDLKTLLDIEITDYQYKDVISKGAGSYKKLIAQQVEKVYPQAVSKKTDAIPDIYKAADCDGEWVMLSTDLKVGEKVSLIDPKNQAATYEVVEVTKDKFRTRQKLEHKRVFVYGREVNDFRTVDYDAISMLNVSATQELARQVAALKKSEARVESLEREVAELKKLVASIAGQRANEGEVNRRDNGATKGVASR
jgi:hypothetical protein